MVLKRGIGTMKFTQQSVQKLKLPPGKKEALFWDDSIPGFGIRFREGGSSRWIYQYAIGQQQRRMTFKVAMDDFATARAMVKEAAAKVALGKDPAADKHASKERAVETFAWAMEQFLAAKKPETKPLYHNEMERHLRKDAKRLHRLQLDGIDRRTIADLLNSIKGLTRNRVRASLSGLFNFAMREGWCPSNPVLATRRLEERSRDRVLSPAELDTIYSVADDGTEFGDIIRLLILTAARRSEIGGLRWDEIDWDTGEITIAAERTKNSIAHVIPMSNAVMQILKARYDDENRGDRQFVFGLRDSGFGGWSKAKTELDKRLSAVADFHLHDLRRTAATRMADIGIHPHHIEAVLNHISGHKGGVAGVYNRSSYASEKRIALNKWADVVLGKLSNITELKRA
jgi:integrase